MAAPQTHEHTRLLLAFIAGALSMFAVNGGLSQFRGQTVIIQEPVPMQQNQQAATASSTASQTPIITTLPDSVVKNGCRNDQDCPSPYMVCSQQRKCVTLENPVGSCSQPFILTYVDPYNRAKHTYCENGCELTEYGAQCKQ